MAIKENHYKDIPNDHPLKERIEEALSDFRKVSPGQLVYCISKPLGGEDDNEYPYPGLVLMSPNHKLVFIGIENRPGIEEFAEYFLTDINSLSSKYKYQKYIGRYQQWRDKVMIIRNYSPEAPIDFSELLSDGHNEVREEERRLIKYLISLSTGCINILSDQSMAIGNDMLEEVRNKILLFDADQTRFLYTSYNIKKLISVQGLSGTGKTELLLHKLKEIYSQSTLESPIRVFFTCHNKALASEIRRRVPDFFNRMKFDRQINWDNDFWIRHAWGSHANPNSGLYSFICNYYQLPFQMYYNGLGYKQIYGRVLESLSKISKREFKHCFDYILIDENQDFPEEFFEVCKKIVKYKVYTAGDVFQNIFDQIDEKPKGFDISLHRCYRTDPRTLMFAHAVGLGLKEDIKYNWFTDKEWNSFGYNVTKDRRKGTITLKREKITRFDGEELEDSVIIENNTNIHAVCGIINSLKDEFPSIKAGDIAIIMIDDDKEIYGYMDKLTARIQNDVGWDVIRAIEKKQTDPNMVYLTNTNNVKGLEFPFVICITSKIQDAPAYRNKIYTMLTRSFLRTYLMIKEMGQAKKFEEIYKDIKSNGGINDILVPTPEEEANIKHALLELHEDEVRSVPWDDFIEQIFEEMGVRQELRTRLKEMLKISLPGSFDKEKIQSQVMVLRNLV